jgi:hypothetical protein
MKQPGKDIAKGLLILAVFLLGLNYFLIWMFDGYSFRALRLWPIILGLGIAMVIFPGASVTAAESADDDKEISAWWAGTPILHKIMWMVGAVAPIVIMRILNCIVLE